MVRRRSPRGVRIGGLHAEDRGRQVRRSRRRIVGGVDLRRRDHGRGGRIDVRRIGRHREAGDEARCGGTEADVAAGDRGAGDVGDSGLGEKDVAAGRVDGRRWIRCRRAPGPIQPGWADCWESNRAAPSRGPRWSQHERDRRRCPAMSWSIQRRGAAATRYDGAWGHLFCDDRRRIECGLASCRWPVGRRSWSAAGWACLRRWL